MKLANVVKSMVSLGMIGTTALLMTACNGSGETTVTASEPTATTQVIVVTATPTTTATITVTDVTSATAEATETTISYSAGTLLKGSSDGVFYVTEAGTRQHIYDWDTFLSLGFKQERIVEVDDVILETIPLKGSLTRLIQHEKQLYLAINGELWQVDHQFANMPDLTKRLKANFSVSKVDESLVESRTIRKGLRSGALLRQGGITYYVDETAILIPVANTLGKAVIDAPGELLGLFNTASQVNQTQVQLAQVKAANVRRGPDTKFEVIGTVHQDDTIIVTGRNPDGSWLQLNLANDAVGWLSASLVDDTVPLHLVPTINTQPLWAEIETEATMNAKDEPSELQSILCDDVPIRGFGKVWGDHLDVQNKLGCPNSWRGGEHSTNAAVQTFQNGLMLWLEQDRVNHGDPVYVFFNDGSYQRFGDLGTADPDKIGSIPAPFHMVGDKFSKVYWEGTGARVQERLGYATSQTVDSAGSFQEFRNGRMFWAKAIDSIFVIYNYGYYDENDNYLYSRTWAQYEDEF